MKLVRIGNRGSEAPGVLLDDDTVALTGSIIDDYNRHFFADSSVIKSIKNVINDLPKVSSHQRLGTPLIDPSKIICVGLNYASHAEEGGMPIPEEPVLFFKATSSITGPNDNIVIPKGSFKTDWEVELAIVIGRQASYVNQENAFDHVFGYLLHNDVSERTFQLERGGQWVKGKSADSFAPLGPWLVTKDEIADPGNLDLWLKVNDVKLQSGNTSDMVFNVAQIVSYISQYMTLLPGDIISTGTPAGVGLGLKPPRYLKPGDVVELGISGLGVARQEVIAYSQ